MDVVLARFNAEYLDCRNGHENIQVREALAEFSYLSSDSSGFFVRHWRELIANTVVNPLSRRSLALVDINGNFSAGKKQFTQITEGPGWIFSVVQHFLTVDKIKLTEAR